MPQLVEPKPFEEITREDFQDYEDVRQRGHWNMFDPYARQATGLDAVTYQGVMRHYTELRKKYMEE